MTVKKLFQRLKRNKRLRRTVKNILKFNVSSIKRFFRRNPRYFFYTPNAAFIKSHVNNDLENKFANRLQNIEENKEQDLLLFKNVISFPLGDGKMTNHSGGIADGKTYSLIPEAIHFNGVFCQELPQIDPSELAIAGLPAIKHIVLLGGILYNNFGHFLLESLGRLWAYKQVKELDPYILFYTYWGKPDYFDRKNYVHQVLKGFDIPLDKILFIDKIAKIDRIIVPAQKYGYEFCKKPDAVFLDFVKGFSFPASIPFGLRRKEKIYVSRAKLPTSLGKLIGEIFFEEYLQSCGYTIFYPEKHSLYEQLSVYNNSKKLIFADGGALHACILLPDLEADVAVISRRRDTRWIPKDITDQFVGYGKEVLWIDAVKEQYQFGLETWNAISAIDWYSASQSLKQHGYVDSVFDRFRQIEYPNQVKEELYKYILTIKKNPQFIDFMMKMNEDQSQ